jgi:type I restriction enzyme S subunit
MIRVEVVELGTVAEIVMGTSPPGSSYNHEGIGDPLLNGPTEFGPHHPDPVLFTSAARRYAESGDILFCVRGSTTGRMNWADRRYAIGRGVAAIRGKSASETTFLKAAIELALPDVLAGATGSTMPNLNADAMRRIPVSVNPNSERVGAIFAAVDDLIENNRRRVELLEEMARAIYREWFVHFRYPGHEDIPLVESPLGPIPEGWRVSTCGAELEVLGGGTPSKKEGTYWDAGDIGQFQ